MEKKIRVSAVRGSVKGLVNILDQEDLYIFRTKDSGDRFLRPWRFAGRLSGNWFCSSPINFNFYSHKERQLSLHGQRRQPDFLRNGTKIPPILV